MEKISLKAMEATVKDVCTKYFDFDFDSLKIPVKINGRLSKSLGQMVYSCRHNKPLSIEFSKELISGIYKIETVESVIKHEVTHLVLFVRGEEFRDGSKNFEDTIKKIGGTSTRTIKALRNYHAKCSCCGERCLTTSKKSTYKKYINNKWYVSGCCHSMMIPDGESILEDETEFKNMDAGELLRKNMENEQQRYNKIAKKVVAEKVNKPVKPQSKQNNEDIIIDPITHLIAPKNGKIKVNQTALWRTLTYYVDKRNDDEIKFLYKSFKEDFINGYRCLTKNRMKYIDSILKVED